MRNLPGLTIQCCDLLAPLQLLRMPTGGVNSVDTLDISVTAGGGLKYSGIRRKETVSLDQREDHAHS